MRIHPCNVLKIGVVAMLTFATAAFAQQLPPPVPTPHTPNLLGIYPGMPLQAAVAQLQKQSSNVYVSVDLPQGFTLTRANAEKADSITGYVTNPPTGSPAVWMITRTWNRMNGGTAAAMTVSGLLSALHAKYGPETMHKSGLNGLNWFYWIFDRNGKLLSRANPVLMGCKAYAFTTSFAGVPNFSPDQSPCYKSFFAVTVTFSAAPANPVINDYTLELVNLPYAARSAMITANAKNAAANRVRRAELQRAKRNTPTF